MVRFSCATSAGYDAASASGTSCADVRAAPYPRAACSVLRHDGEVFQPAQVALQGVEFASRRVLRSQPVHELDGGHAAPPVAGSVQSICL